MNGDPLDSDRRRLLAVGGGAIVAGAAPALATRTAPPMPMEPTLATPGLTFAFDARITIGIPIEQGDVDGMRRRIIPITGGSFAGPRLGGDVLAGGADWQTIRSDGTAVIYARYTLRTTDGTIIGIENPGVRRGPAAVLARIAAGEAVDPALYYFRTTPRFTVPDGRHGWLGDSMFVANAARFADHVTLRVYAVD